MSGTNGVADARRIIVDNIEAADRHAKGRENLIAELEGDYKRIGEKYQASKAANAQLAAELATVQAECCRLTDVNGDLAAAHERLRGAALSVIRGGQLSPVRGAYHGEWTATPDDLLGDLERAITGEAKPAELTEADVIDPSFEPAEPFPPGWRPVGVAWFNKFQAKMNALLKEYEENGDWCHADLMKLSKVWGERLLPFEPPTDKTATGSEGGVNARLLAAAKAACDSWNENMNIGNYNGSRTEIDDEVMDELEEAVDAAQEEGDTSKPDQPSDCGGVNGGQVIREQSEVIKRLTAELADADEINGSLALQVAALSQVSAAAAELRSELKTMDFNYLPITLHRLYKSLDFALDGLPKGEGCEAKPCPAPCETACEAPCQQAQPCPERVHMLAVAARNLIVSHRRGTLSQCDVHTLDFALDGLI